MKVSLADKLQQKRYLLVERTAEALGITTDNAESLLLLQRHQSFRINSNKTDKPAALLEQLRSLGWSGEPHTWYPQGYTIPGDKRAISDSTAAQEGAIYVQNAASWLPVLALAPQENEKILDLCAAPGGKAAHILERTNNRAVVWVNDNSRPRLAKMAANFARLGVQPAATTLYDIRHIAKKLEREQFDKILLDAPCSGEGMMRLDTSKDFASWSVAHIHRLQSLQKKALSQAWQLLKPGGTLVYSTCTMAPEENEAVIDYALRRLPDAELQPLSFALPNQCTPVQTWHNKSFSADIRHCLRLIPSEYIEAFFVAKLVKLDK